MKKILSSLIPRKWLKAILSFYHFAWAGASALFYRFPSREIFVIGVTGTKGKSSTTEIVNCILEEAGYKTAVSGTIRFKIGDEVILIGKGGKEQITVEELAKKIGTINYEIISRINPLLPRIHAR